MTLRPNDYITFPPKLIVYKSTNILRDISFQKFLFSFIPHEYFINVYSIYYLIIIFPFLLVSAAGLWFPLAGWMYKVYAGIFDYWSILYAA